MGIVLLKCYLMPHVSRIRCQWPITWLPCQHCSICHVLWHNCVTPLSLRCTCTCAWCSQTALPQYHHEPPLHLPSHPTQWFLFFRRIFRQISPPSSNQYTLCMLPHSKQGHPFHLHFFNMWLYSPTVFIPQSFLKAKPWPRFWSTLMMHILRRSCWTLSIYATLFNMCQ